MAERVERKLIFLLLHPLSNIQNYFVQMNSLKSNFERNFSLGAWDWGKHLWGWVYLSCKKKSLTGNSSSSIIVIIITHYHHHHHRHHYYYCLLLILLLLLFIIHIRIINFFTEIVFGLWRIIFPSLSLKRFFYSLLL